MQVTVDGNNLDNGTWRRLVGSFGDDTGVDGRRVVVVDFVIQADDAPTLSTRYKSTRDDFIKINPRAVLTLDDTGGVDDIDVSPSDGFHTQVATAVGLAPGHEQTGHSKVCRLYIVADTAPPNAGGAGGAAASGVSTYTGMQGTLRRTITYNAGRVQSRAVLATFVSTFVYGSTLTFTSVENDGTGKARFVLDSGGNAPTAFAAGQRINVLTTNGGYLGVHIVTAVEVGTKKITTDTAYGATAAGTLKQGVRTTGLEHYTAAKTSILEDHLLCDSDGGRDATSGMVLTVDKEEDLTEDGNEVTILLQSEYQEEDLPSLPSNRGLVVNINQSRPERWSPGGGVTPRFLTVTGHFFVDKSVLGSDPLHRVFEASAKGDIEAYVKAETGENAIRLLATSFSSSKRDHRVEFALRYQARNTTVLDYKRTRESREDDDSVHWKVGKYDYDQRPEGLPPKQVTISVSRIGLNKQTLTIAAPSGDGAGAIYRAAGVAEAEEEVVTPFGTVWVQSKTAAFVRRVYQGASGVQVVKA